jgi:hypothetical protein
MGIGATAGVGGAVVPFAGTTPPEVVVVPLVWTTPVPVTTVDGIGVGVPVVIGADIGVGLIIIGADATYVPEVLVYERPPDRRANSPRRGDDEAIVVP